MDVDSSRFFPTSKSTYVVTVSEYEERFPVGGIYVPHSDRTYPFRGLMQFLLLMESLMDRANCPQRNMDLRVFRAGAAPTEFTEGCESFRGRRLASFRITVLIRQNASWQGLLVWNEKKLEAHFRSALELVGLMDDTLSTAMVERQDASK